jgi:hypothetical protein
MHHAVIAKGTSFSLAEHLVVQVLAAAEEAAATNTMLEKLAVSPSGDRGDGRALTSLNELLLIAFMGGRWGEWCSGSIPKFNIINLVNQERLPPDTPADKASNASPGDACLPPKLDARLVYVLVPFNPSAPFVLRC